MKVRVIIEDESLYINLSNDSVFTMGDVIMLFESALYHTGYSGPKGLAVEYDNGEVVFSDELP